jgi:hypothetical protein
LWAGFNLDDHLVRVTSAAPWDLYRVGDPGGLGIAPWIDAGLLPWWTAEDAGFSCFRPLASLTAWTERELWPDLPFLMHAVNLVLFGCLILAVARLYRRIMAQRPAWVAGLATVMFAVDDAHGMAVGWVSSRHLLLGALFGVLALIAHDRWRRDGWWPGAILGATCAGAATLSSEIGGAVVWFFVAYAWMLRADSAPLWRRALAALPSVAVVLVIRLGSVAAGYGVRGTALGRDPWSEPGPFLLAMPSRLSALTFGQWGWVPSDLWVLVPPGEGQFALIAAAAVFVLLMALALGPVLRRSDTARFWVIASVLTMISVSDAFPQDRLLVLVGVGAFGAIAEFLRAVVECPEWWKPGWKSRGRSQFLAWCWVAIHVGVASALLVPRSVTTWLLSGSFERLADDLPSDAAGKTVVVLRATDAWSAVSTPWILRSRSLAAPERVVVVYAGTSSIDVVGEAPDTLVVRPSGGVFDNALAAAFVGTSVPDSRRVGPVELRYRPGEVRVSVAEHSQVRFVAWTSAGYLPVAPPSPGRTTRFPAVRAEAAFVDKSKASPQP